MTEESNELKGKCRAIIKLGPRKGQPCALAEVKDLPGACKFHARSFSVTHDSSTKTVIRSVRIRVRPTVMVRRVLARWFGACRRVWNDCVNADKELKMSMEDLRKLVVSGKERPEWMIECPAHIRSEVVREYISARRESRLLSAYLPCRLGPGLV